MEENVWGEINSWNVYMNNWIMILKKVSHTYQFKSIYMHLKTLHASLKSSIVHG